MTPILRRPALYVLATDGQPMPATEISKTSRRLVCRERSIVRGDGGRFTIPPPSQLEVRSRLSQQSCSFDHLVGASQERGWDREAKRLSGSQIDEFSALRRNTRFPRKAWWCQAESNRRPLDAIG